jgi:hypothetical protein
MYSKPKSALERPRALTSSSGARNVASSRVVVSSGFHAGGRRPARSVSITGR